MKKLLLVAAFFATAVVQDTQARFTVSWSYQTPVSGAYYQNYNYNSCPGCHVVYDMCTCHYPCSIKPNYAANAEGYSLIAAIFGGIASVELLAAYLDDNREQFEAFQVATGLTGFTAIMAFLSYLNVESKNQTVVKNNSKNLVVAGGLIGIGAAALYQLLG